MVGVCTYQGLKGGSRKIRGHIGEGERRRMRSRGDNVGLVEGVGEDTSDEKFFVV